VVAFIGDGGFAMLMAEFHTAVWYGLPIKVVINDNSALGQILWEQMVLGYPEHGVRFRRAEAGLRGVGPRRPAATAPGWRRRPTCPARCARRSPPTARPWWMWLSTPNEPPMARQR